MIADVLTFKIANMLLYVLRMQWICYVNKYTDYIELENVKYPC